MRTEKGEIRFFSERTHRYYGVLSVASARSDFGNKNRIRMKPDENESPIQKDAEGLNKEKKAVY